MIDSKITILKQLNMDCLEWITRLFIVVSGIYTILRVFSVGSSQRIAWLMNVLMKISDIAFMKNLWVSNKKKYYYPFVACI